MELLVVGCGLTGAVIAREMAEKGKNVLLLERRDHVGGNMYDFKDEHGYLVQKYGPHIFHTTEKSILEANELPGDAIKAGDCLILVKEI